MTTATSDDLSGQIAEAVRAVGGVAGLHDGAFGEVATYLPGGKVAGVRVRDDLLDVHIAVRWDHPVGPIAEAVRRAVGPLDDRPVHVTVEDIVQPPSGCEGELS